MKRMLSRLTLALAGVLLAGAGSVSANEVELKNFRVDYGNVASLQRGARDYMAYCSGCHSMKYLRYSRIGEDLQIPADLLKSNVMVGTDKPGDVIKSAMPTAAADWFGRQPPDLSLEARSRGADWIYTYLLGFYLDPSRPTGVNNTVLPGASMPHVLWELQGWQGKPEHKAAAEGEGKGHEAKAEHEHEFEQVTQGSLTPEQYREFVGDLTNFMAYAAEPVKKERIHLGFKVLLFLALLMILTILLKKEFWRDVH